MAPRISNGANPLIKQRQSTMGKSRRGRCLLVRSQEANNHLWSNFLGGISCIENFCF